MSLEMLLHVVLSSKAPLASWVGASNRLTYSMGLRVT